jgi:hypothetical protein
LGGRDFLQYFLVDSIHFLHGRYLMVGRTP